MKRKTRAKFTVLDSARKSIRASTAIKTQATKIRLKEMDDARRKKKKVVKVEEYMPTQEELLEEAKITEEENIKSLGRSVIKPRAELALLIIIDLRYRKFSLGSKNVS